MIWIGYILLLLVAMAGWFLVLLLLPGLFLMTAATAVYALLTRGHIIGWRGLLALLIVTVLAEIAEQFAGTLAMRRKGAGSKAIWGATAGGIVGGVFLTFIPIPILGTILGVCMGAFIGATLMELLSGSGHRQSIGAGLGAVQGRVSGILIKLLAGFVLFVMIVICAWP